MSTYENNVLDWLDSAAIRNPEKIAYADEEMSISFSELQEMVSRIGTGLIRRTGSHNKPIACMIGRNALSVPCMLGIVASGNFYVPLDPEMPADRLEVIMGQIDPAAVLVQEPAHSAMVEGECSCPVFLSEELLSVDADDGLLADCRSATSEDDPLYAICTSGSTGIPKVVLKSHRSILAFIPIFRDTFEFSENDVFANQAPFDFDVSAKDIYTTLYCGASMHIVPRKCFTMPKELVPYMQDRKITCCIWAVSALCLVAQLNVFKREQLTSLKKVLFSGEVMPPKHLDKWRAWYPDVMFVNLYAPSEVTGNCLYHIVGEGEGPEGRLPLGRPFKNCDVMVLKKDMQRIRMGEEGEIYVRCPHLAMGYYRNAERTANSFVQNPTCSDWPQTVYKTGDLARLAEDGRYYFTGRVDFQIKHMGHRIELEELELHMNGIDGVERACCVFDTTKNKIVAFFEGALESRDIIKALNAKLPKYMIPNMFVAVESIPLNARGKIDRAKLLEIAHSNNRRGE